ncbi:high affinity cGMP-specific 3 -5 -cyclic phosphodiesterase 9A-like isoform X2 [Brachionus plicatilis]|uniref:Phosphodiesterase n=1 Tax=Brachionus plicatilis TaxID=10195 RepID=A0A3M7RRZ8_BRAPC|nr:high affinity cGMP-specific 3 -5 -cyclic phosphodiesterase 9A-like isoform X2 [Brachionus plicatilis]
MGIGALSGVNQSSKSIYIDYKGKIHKVIFSRNSSNEELQYLVKTALKTNKCAQIILKDSDENCIQLSPSIPINPISNPYKVEFLDLSSQNGIENKNNDDTKTPQEFLAQVVKEFSKAIKFEDSKKELMDRITNLENRIDGSRMESLKAIEVEKCRKEVKDLREMFQKASLPKQEDRTKKQIMENIPNYQKYQLSQETIQYLKTPTFNIWHWEANEMLTLIEHMYHELGLVREFNINPTTLKRWLLCIQANYRNNPFHNFRHCFCVAQMMYGMIHLCNLQSCMTKIEIATLITAAICHDLDHPGYNNAYQINARTELAIRYNDISPLENHHCAVAFQILSNPACNIFFNASDETFKEIRGNMVKLILATDMAKHKEILAELEEYVASFDFKNKDHMNALKMILIKCCDISNEVRPMEISEPWLDCLLEEYFNQSDREKEEGLPVAPFMDREKVTKPGAQVGFIKFVLIPMFEAVAKIFPIVQETMVTTLYQSYNRYSQLIEAEKKDKK